MKCNPTVCPAKSWCKYHLAYLAWKNITPKGSAGTVSLRHYKNCDYIKSLKKEKDE